MYINITDLKDNDILEVSYHQPIAKNNIEQIDLLDKIAVLDKVKTSFKENSLKELLKNTDYDNFLSKEQLLNISGNENVLAKFNELIKAILDVEPEMYKRTGKYITNEYIEVNISDDEKYFVMVELLTAIMLIQSNTVYCNCQIDTESIEPSYLKINDVSVNITDYCILKRLLVEDKKVKYYYRNKEHLSALKKIFKVETFENYTNYKEYREFADKFLTKLKSDKIEFKHSVSFALKILEIELSDMEVGEYEHIHDCEFNYTIINGNKLDQKEVDALLNCIDCLQNDELPEDIEESESSCEVRYVR